MAKIVSFRKRSPDLAENPISAPAESYALDTTCIVLILLGVLLRIPGLFHDLWLDEIWALETARQLSSPLELFFGRLDGHTTLYMVYLWLLRSFDHPAILRALSFLFGCGLLVISALLIPRENRVERYALLFIVALSYPLVLYAGEARGYSGMLFFGALSLLLLERQPLSVTCRQGVLFFITNICAFLFHFSYIQFYAALFLYALLMSVSRLETMREQWSYLYRLFAPATLFMGAMYLLVIRTMPPGTGTLFTYPEAVFNAIAIHIGAPLLSEHAITAGIFTLAASLCSLVLLVVEIARQKNLGTYRWIFFGTALFLAPAAVLFLLEPRVVHPRYFLMSMFTAYLIYAALVSDLYTRAQHKLLSIGGLALLFLFGNGSQLGPLFEHGKGSYRQAVVDMNQQASLETPLIVSSDHDFRTGKVFEYFRKQQGITQLIYKEKESQFDEHSTFYITHTEDSAFSPPPRLSLGQGEVFQLQETYESAALAGFRWFVYRLIEEPHSGG